MSSLREVFEDLLQRHVPRLTIRGRRAMGLCPFHQEKTPSLSIDFDKGVFYCHGCGVGGGVRRFAELVDEPWGTMRSQSRATRAHRDALAAARSAYDRWQRERLIMLSDEYRELVAECEVTEIGFRASRRRRDLYSESDRLYWTKRLGVLYDRRSALEYALDLLTYARWEPERFEWWNAEVEGGRLAA
jgi:hypothetical protein